MIHLPSLFLGGILVASLAVNLQAAAQDECPDSRVCVDLGDTQVVEIDPSLGFLQVLVVEERELTITDFDGTRSEPEVKVATFVEDGSAYRLEREDIVPQSGVFADAALGDVFVLTESGG